MTKHYVTFFSPGTFFAESSRREVPSWDVHAAQQLAREIVERHGATPYAFQFSTMERCEDEWEPQQTQRSQMYFLGGTVETLAEVKQRALPSDRILVANMEGNGWDRIITTTNGYRWTQPFGNDDVRLDWPPSAKET